MKSLIQRAIQEKTSLTTKKRHSINMCISPINDLNKTLSMQVLSVTLPFGSEKLAAITRHSAIDQ